jgi:hypothetical protein
MPKHDVVWKPGEQEETCVAVIVINYAETDTHTHHRKQYHVTTVEPGTAVGETEVYCSSCRGLQTSCCVCVPFDSVYSLLVGVPSSSTNTEHVKCSSRGNDYNLSTTVHYVKQWRGSTWYVPCPKHIHVSRVFISSLNTHSLQMQFVCLANRPICFALRETYNQIEKNLE